MMAKCEQHMWWYRSLHDLTLRKIKKNCHIENPRILDAGCGTGGLLLYLKNNGFQNLTGFDLSPDAVEYALDRNAGVVHQHDITNLDKAYPKNYFDIITSHDIVCLLGQGEDKIAISELLSVLKPGGILLMNFPALKAFYGSHDVAIGIQRRYSKKSLESLIKEKADIRDITYWPFFLSPAIWVFRLVQNVKSFFVKQKKLVSDVKMPAVMLNHVFYKLTSLENNKLRLKPWGSSLFLVLQKPV